MDRRIDRAASYQSTSKQQKTLTISVSRYPDEELKLYGRAAYLRYRRQIIYLSTVLYIYIHIEDRKRV